ncbi:hypothetical protein COX69_03120 [Candidatus Falkowbacteria bacterium CG_4_10_14_0_2_um_filter_48_10]|uniref:Uncharacterized protein n=1 Tax=Candidatus Falkowbacteria bacterium CG23_combo_of_CG06-09_8_20_14_all_49_15 TaxID=1974572 RepID=A0A2G9ZLW9_9BACT|nr:MAG: hypothetical protein COX22_00425 [Candidatus Falkowbacteria bacterium CG23_combo_of_CG06-09_8_20_14_all_49_15]PJA08094.1 MAG: hypothetical protein COX69_03120 [Candidatus Falkowbacteria bacterium CG_4_10_14_0_2_um_filter_48_10]
MKLVIFAGGIGTRLWPLSRESAPKQFDRLFFGQSTLEMAVSRVRSVFGWADIFIQTVPAYEKIVREQIPDLPLENIILEPARRNLGPAVCLTGLELKKKGISGPLAILWADHLMDRPAEFTAALLAGEELIQKKPDRFVFLAEKPRFANNNLGWVTCGPRIGNNGHFDFFRFAGWHYKPTPEKCSALLAGGDSFWNPGYFITDLDFLLDEYRRLAPEIYEKVSQNDYENALAIHFDRAIIEKVDLDSALVIKTDMGWSDPGTLYALKEALAPDPSANVVQGEVFTYETKDCLIHNQEQEKLVAAVGLDGLIVVNTKDALLVAAKDQVVLITDMLKKMKAEGKEKYS